MPDPLQFRYHRGGLHFPALGLWMDPHEPVRDGSLSFVSHAHSDHTGQHSEVLFTEPTRRLMRSRVSGERVEHVLAFGDEADSGRFGRPPGAFRIQLTPAGHILGSAMARIVAGGGSLLYTGDFKLRRGLSAEPCEPLPADVLVMETTYGRPHYRFPSTDEVVASVLRFCREALDNDEIPVLLGYSLGKSQEILCSLARAGLPVMLHSAVATLTRVYADLGFAFPAWSDWNLRKAAGHVLVAPPGGTAQDLRRRLPQARTATLTGWALDSGSRFRSGTDATFPLSDHADFPDLVELVRRVAPKRIHTLHGFAAEFAAHLRGLGWDARPLGMEEQLELRLAEPPAFPTSESAVQDGPARIDTASPTSAPTTVAAPASLRAFARVCAAIRAVASKHAKVEELARFLGGLPADVLPTVVRWMCGSASTGVGAPELKIGWKALQEALCGAACADSARFHQLYLVHSDTGETAAALFEGRRTDGDDGWSLAGLKARLDEFPGLGSQKERTTLLTGTFRRADAEEIRYLVKILTGNLRIGLKEGLVEEAVAAASGAPAEAVRRASMLLGDLGEAAVLAREGRLQGAGLVPCRPIRLMLAVPEPDAASVMRHADGWARPEGVPTRLHVEDKYDGIRCQLHKVGDRVSLFSRDLQDLTATFPEIVDAARLLASDVILDGELVAMDEGRPAPFALLQRRLGRRSEDLFLGSEIPVEFVAFDLLWKDAVTGIDQPLRERRAGLEGLAFPRGLRMAPVRFLDSADAVDAAFEAARSAGNEGLMLKDPESPYTPGRRGGAWIKLKKAQATLDCVIVAAELGHGRRREVLSDYTFAIQESPGGRLLTIGKAYTGLTDAEIRELTRRLVAATERTVGRRREVRPEIVLEIAFDSLRPSARHDSGLAMRFPRIVRIRNDKGPADIDTLATARKLAAQ